MMLIVIQLSLLCVVCIFLLPPLHFLISTSVHAMVLLIIAGLMLFEACRPSPIASLVLCVNFRGLNKVTIPIVTFTLDLLVVGPSQDWNDCFQKSTYNKPTTSCASGLGTNGKRCSRVNTIYWCIVSCHLA